MTARRVAGLALGFGLAACGAPAPSPQNSSVPAASNTTAPPPAPVPLASPTLGDPRLSAAIRAAFPRGTSVDSDNEQSPRRFDEHRLVDAPFGPVLVSYGAIEDAAHVTPGVIAVTYLKPAPGGFTIVKSFPRAVENGSMGALTEWAVSDKFSDLPVVYAEGGGTWQGVSCATTTLTELAPRGPVELAAIRTAYDNDGEGFGAKASIKGKIGDIVKGTGFTVHYSGTQSFDERYTRQGNRFVRQGRTRVPEC